MIRTVRVEDVQRPPWSTRATAWGYDIATGEHVAFGLSVERGTSLRYEMDVTGQAVVEVNDFEVLFTERAPERTDLAP